MRHALALTAALGALVCPLLTTPTASAAGAHTPVVFVHGYGGSANEMVAIERTFLDAGYTAGDLHALDFPNTQKNEQTAAQLKPEVDRVLTAGGHPKVDLIGFSMGSLSARYYLKNLSGTDKVAHFASIAGANHGTSLAYLCLLTADITVCPQMVPTSAFLRQLNSGDETPGTATGYATWASHGDTTITPPESVFLNGADNHWTAQSTDHVGTLTNKAVQSEVVSWFGG